MSFGWSAGDIATALVLLRNIIEALDSVDGAASYYREAVGFLRDLERTLTPLESLEAWKTYPLYANDILRQVQQIKGPVQDFLGGVVKYKKSLGEEAPKGHHRYIWKKLQWYLTQENKVLALKAKIGGHMRIIDTLLYRLILDVILKTQDSLPECLKAAMTQGLSSELLSHIHDNLTPLKSDVLQGLGLQKEYHNNIALKLSETYTGLSSDMKVIKEHLMDSKVVQQRIMSCLMSIISEEMLTSRDGWTARRKVFATTQKCSNCHMGSSGSGRDGGWTESIDTCQTEIDLNMEDESIPGSHGDGIVAEFPIKDQEFKVDSQESLREVYYLVLLYIGHFMKNFFLFLSHCVQPPRALMPVLLAQYNISFLDAIGSPPRILPYEYFRNFKVLQAYIHEEFKNLPGSTWVNLGRYQLMSALYNRPLAEDNWNRLVTPGTTVTMAMVLRKTAATNTNATTQNCPAKMCPGTWERSGQPSWRKCPVCQIEVFTSMPDNPNVQQEESDYTFSSNNPDSGYSRVSLGSRAKQKDRYSREISTAHRKSENLPDDIDIEAFRRILEIHTISTGTGPPDIALVPQPSVAGMGRDRQPVQPNHLTYDSLAAYQSALAAAAFAAANKGIIRRDGTQTIPMTAEQEDTQPGHISDLSHTSHSEPFSFNYDIEDNFDYDDALEDEKIIAAANAEVLANDMDGFYGQEFGFYSTTSCEAEYTNGEYTNGGYFGPREPNLTPRTERSEYANHNSFMSIPMHRPDSVINPDLAQLADIPEYEGDMSLDVLLGLRRSAWGGSEASLHSSNGSPRSVVGEEVSPVDQLPPWTKGAVSARI